MSQHDNTNSGVIFQPHDDQSLSGQGKVNIEGRDEKIVLIRERLKRDGPLELVVYKKAGVLFVNDKADQNDKAPKFSGPLDDHKDYRLAAWPGQKDGRRYMSLKVSRKDNQSGSSQQSQNGAGQGGSSGWDLDGDIPF